MSTFTLLNMETEQPLRQFLYSCAIALTDRLAVIDRRFADRDEGTPLSGRLQWARAGLSVLHHMTPNDWRPPKGKLPVTGTLWALAERIGTCTALDELLDLETAIRREAMHVLMDTRSKPVSLLPAPSPSQEDDTVPTEPGWYWEWRAEGLRLVQLPVNGQWPTPWREQRAAALAAADPQARASLERLSDRHWRVTYAGPVPSPLD